MKMKAQKQTDTDTRRDKGSRVVDRTLSAISAFHLETPRSLPQFRKRHLDLDRPWSCTISR
ncbi:MAG: hypothetical protein V3V55_05015, partial [Rhodospirillales bacterium]